MNLRIALAACAALALAACGRQDAPASPAAATGDYVVRPWEIFAGPGSMAPDLTVAPDGRVLLSWLNRPQGRRSALQFASYTDEGGWQSQPRTIAVGNSLVANWADVPHLRATADGALWAQWLQANAQAPSAYDIVLARSRDGGMRWEQMVQVNADGQGSYSGFAALWPEGSNRLGIAWLDGRAKQGGHDGHEGHDDGAPMQLRASRFDGDMQRGEELVLDAMTCDCCQTDVAMTARGALLVYRDREAGPPEVRDIKAIRRVGEGWGKPVSVHADGWEMGGCPVNGPAVAASGDQAVVGWFTAAGGAPAVMLARSGDAGGSFAPPVVVDRDAAVLGQVDVALDGVQAWVAWLREDASGQTLMLARYPPDLSKPLQTIEVARLAGRGRATGAPRLAVGPRGLWVVWTDVADGVSQLKGAQVTR
jgi:hypothetical protein